MFRSFFFAATADSRHPAVQLPILGCANFRASSDSVTSEISAFTWAFVDVLLELLQGWPLMQDLAKMPVLLLVLSEMLLPL